MDYKIAKFTKLSLHLYVIMLPVLTGNKYKNKHFQHNCP